MIPIDSAAVGSAQDHWQHASDERGGYRRRQQRHHSRDEQHHDDRESLRVRFARLEQHDDQIGPRRPAERGGKYELAPPDPRRLILIAAIQKGDRQRIPGQNRASDEGEPGRQRAGLDPGQRRCANAKRNNPEHRCGAAVDLREQAHHRARMAGNRVRLGQRPPRLSELDGHLAPARGGIGIGLDAAPAPAAQVCPDITHSRPTRTLYLTSIMRLN
jgi:hypothetical protein